MSYKKKQAAGLSDSHLLALLNLQSKFAAQMKELGSLHKQSKVGLSPLARWESWVSRILKRRAFNEN